MEWDADIGLSMSSISIICFLYQQILWKLFTFTNILIWKIALPTIIDMDFIYQYCFQVLKFVLYFVEANWFICSSNHRHYHLITNISHNFISCLLVQHECIPQALLGTDIICQAKSGMGKTAVFVLSTLHQIDPTAGETHVVVLCHTRELAFQIQKEYQRFSKYLPDVKSRVFYGGNH